MDLLILVVAGAAIIGPAQASAAVRCPAPDKPARIKINISPAKVIYKTGHSRGDLERLQRARGRHAARGNWRILGLTLTDFKYAIKTSARLVSISGGRYCAQPVSYDLTIGYSDFLVYIDRKYRRGSCEYRAIRKHEEAHVALYRGYLTRYLPGIKRQAQAAAAGVPSVVVSTPDLGVKYIQDQMQRRVAPLVKKLNREDALVRLVDLIKKACISPVVRRKTRPSRSARQKRMNDKRHRAGIKSSRGSVSGDD